MRPLTRANDRPIEKVTRNRLNQTQRPQIAKYYVLKTQLQEQFLAYSRPFVLQFIIIIIIFYKVCLTPLLPPFPPFFLHQPPPYNLPGSFSILYFSVDIFLAAK